MFAQASSEPAKLWAGVSVLQPVFQLAGIAALQISFAVVNDGTTTANPNIEASHLFINGVEPQDTVRWESANFKSADLVFRVVPTAPN